ncbi:PRA1 family protein B1-like [Pyrus x bretschneideri]|uniref:PRA1 family protein B1-like n=1 Tax=Pyrus x bretschneideri TaxID=225117 RepID=UPI00202E6E25|nr:PRA1 family protein B1-like [Pyrus x bretschneideri]
MSPSKPQSHSVTATTYTSIPISVSGSDAITRSIKNLNDAVSRRRPWSEFASSISRLDSLSSALTRIQTNANHFRVNYFGLVNVTLGLGVGLVLCGVHGLLRNTEGLFLNENEAASQGLIGPTYSTV